MSGLISSAGLGSGNQSVASLAPIASLSGPELFYVVQNGVERKATTAQIQTFVGPSAAIGATTYVNTSVGLASTTVGQYFSVPSANQAEYLILYVHDSGPTATEIKRYPALDASCANLITKPDLTLGQQSWTITGVTGTFDDSGFHADKTTSNGLIDINLISPTTMTLVAGHKYTFYADFTLSGDGDGVTLGKLATIAFAPFINGSTGNTYLRKQVPVGVNGGSIAQFAVTTFVATTSGTFSNCYFGFGNNTLRDISGQSVVACSLHVDIRVLMLIDLGISTDPAYALTDDELIAAITRLGPPYTGSPAKVARAVQSVRAARAEYADHAVNADHATDSDIAEALRSTWKDKRLLTIGHSLVSQQGWQGPLSIALEMNATVTVLGIAGGTVHPKPDVPTPGFFSRAYMASVYAALPSDGMGGRILPDATIIWAGANDVIKTYDAGATLLLERTGYDRVMTTAEQDEYEARNLSLGAAADLSAVLTTGLVPTYKTLWLTAIRNFIVTLGLDAKPSHRLFMVREPQAFYAYSGSLLWSKTNYIKNEIHRKVADDYGLPLIDLFANSGINIWTRGSFLNIEDSHNLMIHLNADGHKVVAKYIERFMLQHPPLALGGVGVNLGFPTAAGDLGPWNA